MLFVFLKEKRMKELRKKAMHLPESPGVYIMKDKNGKIIYIGKAKSLKDRVSQYFGSQVNHTDKVKQMVCNVDDFEYILTDSEYEALVLECSLIKQNKPKYNILLKDDKGYHYIKVTDGEWPRISEVKQMLDDKGEYIGPYTSAKTINDALDAALKIFKLPTCNLNFSKSKKNRACLNYYINQCCAPCIKKISKEKYMENVRDAVEFLKGGDKISIKKLTSKMQDASDNLEFEKAAELRDKILSLKKISSEKQKVILSKIKEQDIVALIQSKKMACFEVFHFTNNKLSDREEFMLDDVGEGKSARGEFLQQYYLKKENIPGIILMDEEPESKSILEEWLSRKKGKTVKIVIPKKGENFKLVEMCKNNAAECMARRLSRTNKETYALEELSKALNLKTFPEYIESYDISNLFGDENVAAMVVFFNGRPLKSNYRKFKIKSFSGQDDYTSMREVILRRVQEYKKLENQNENDAFAKLPDLILLDGGKGQVSAVKEVLSESKINIPVFGMVKDNKHRTRAITSEGYEISIGHNHALFTLISSIQEEVHRFTIGYHRKLRNKKSTSSELLNIPGIGKKRAALLLKSFKSVDKIKNASLDELKSVKGITESVAGNIFNYLKKD